VTESLCPEHQQPWKYVPPGTSRAGKPYPGWWKCPVEGCGWRLGNDGVPYKKTAAPQPAPPQPPALPAPPAPVAAAPAVPVLPADSHYSLRLEAASISLKTACEFLRGDPAVLDEMMALAARIYYGFVSPCIEGKLPRPGASEPQDADINF